MRKKIIVFICGFSCILALSGCSQGVEITNEESELIAEYSAGILLKYDKNYDSGLSYMVYNEKSEVSDSIEISQADETVKPYEETDVIESLVYEENVESIEKPDSLSTLNLNEALGLQQIGIAYTGYEFADFYPNRGSGGDMDFVVNPKSGNKLLVLKFNMNSISEEIQKIDLLVTNPDFNIMLNGTTTLNNIKTVLLNDLSTLSASIEVGASLETVILFEVPDDYEEEISSLILNINLNEVTTDVVLQ